jgi:uncharacterized protein
MSAEAMRCPKCGGEMPSRRRNGVLIEQCRDCHGIYLDPGEFERLIAIESSQLGIPDSDADDDAPAPLHGGARPAVFLS